MSASGTRQQIIVAADKLFYEQGFEATSFADIAARVGLSRGNFYYHFRTKDEILEAVIAHRRANTSLMLEQWDATGETPRDRVQSFINLLIVNQEKIMARGCPVGTLCSELAKLDHTSTEEAAGLFSQFRDWLAHQFAALGRSTDANTLALHILMRSQGVATLAMALRDDAFVKREVAEMSAWLAAQTSSQSTHKPSANKH